MTTQPSDAAAEDPLAARAAHDAIGFDRLAGEYNLMNISSYGRVFANLIADELQHVGPDAKALDIGCGAGIGRDSSLQWGIRRRFEGEYWGLEPDETVPPAEGLFDHYQHALMETAELPEGAFDVAYSSMVMEHVADPAAFLSALAQCLKPGGVYLFVTPNARSFVPRMTRLMHRLGIDELALRLVRKQQEVDEYHYPVQFLFNTPQQIASHAERFGFEPPRCAFIEGTGSYSYLRGPLKLLKPPLLAKRRWIQRPDRLATLICRMRKRAAS